MNNATPIETLFAVYVATRNGAPLDVPAYADLLLAAAAVDCDIHMVERTFEGLGYFTRMSALGASAGAGALCRAAFASGGWRGAIRVASVLGMSDVWAIAMSAHFGPLGTHNSRCGADGVPTAETLAEFPRIGAAMAESARKFEYVTGWYDRILAGKDYTSQVVDYRAPIKVAA